MVTMSVLMLLSACLVFSLPPDRASEMLDDRLVARNFADTPRQRLAVGERQAGEHRRADALVNTAGDWGGDAGGRLGRAPPVAAVALGTATSGIAQCA